MNSASESTIITTIAKRVREARKEYGLSQDELARKVGLTRVRINQIENGREKTIKPRTIQKIAQALGRPEAYFYSDMIYPIDCLPEPLQDVVARLFALPYSQQQKLGYILEQLINWYESEVIMHEKIK